jgi:membrane carboxypeptidase/penicillin-binding protein
MTAAYAAFANSGMVLSPTLVRRVETTDGEVLFTSEQTPQRGVSESTAYQLTSMMADVINAGTGAAARSVGFRLPAAGKTGTTNDYHDAWFVGFTPHLATGVWIGYDQPRTIIGRGYAAVLAVPLWGRFMAIATRKDRPEWFTAPSTITSATICRLSGKLATDACHEAVSADEAGNLTRGSLVYTEYFVQGTEPTESCPIHRKVLGGALSALAALVGGPSKPAESSQAVSSQSSPVRVAEAPPAPTNVETPPEAPRKRGFWSRVFGVGKDKK